FEMSNQLGFTSSSAGYGPDNFLEHNEPANMLPSAIHSIGDGRPVLLNPHNDARVEKHEDVEENLFLADREVEFIKKALKKHKGRRRDAANELGISERTLYRKI